MFFDWANWRLKIAARLLSEGMIGLNMVFSF